MNIHESFTLEEGAPSKKRKRILIKLFVSLIGLRNLITKVDKKRKSTIRTNDNEI